MTDERERHFTVPWSPTIDRCRPIEGAAYWDMWRVAHALGDLAARSTGALVTSLDLAIELGIPHAAVSGAVKLLVELEVIERVGGGDIVVHLCRAPRCSIRDDFTADERAFAERYPDAIDELDLAVAMGKTTAANALVAFRRFAEIAGEVASGTLSDNEGMGIAIEISRNHATGNRWVN